jgi:hypothetical protein
MLLTF